MHARVCMCVWVRTRRRAGSFLCRITCQGPGISQRAGSLAESRPAFFAQKRSLIRWALLHCTGGAHPKECALSSARSRSRSWDISHDRDAAAEVWRLHLHPACTATSGGRRQRLSVVKGTFNTFIANPCMHSCIMPSSDVRSFQSRTRTSTGRCMPADMRTCMRAHMAFTHTSFR